MWKYILFGMAGVIALLFVISLFMKKEMVVVRDITIDRPVDQVFAYVRNLKSQDHYSKWVMADPAMTKGYKNIDGQPGFIYSWESTKKDVGKGEQEIIRIDEGRRVISEVRFERPMTGVAQNIIETTPIGSKTKVQWRFVNNMNCPMRIFALFMNIDKILGKDLEVSLQRLKSNLELNPV